MGADRSRPAGCPAAARRIRLAAPAVAQTRRLRPMSTDAREEIDPTGDASVGDLLAFLDAATSPFHAVAEVASRLEHAGFTRLDERDEWRRGAGAHLVVRDGTLVAWDLAEPHRVDDGFRIIGAHTDSPNLRIKPRPDTGRAGFRQLGVEVYGGALLNSWLDRDLGLSGRVAVRAGAGEQGSGDVDLRLVKIDRPLLRVPQLAIHLDRGVNENGLVLNPQQHLVPVWGTGPADPGALPRLLAEEIGVGDADVLSWELMLHDVAPATLLGSAGELVSSGRIDNLVSCWAAMHALLGASRPGRGPGATGDAGGARGVPVICLFDHEEIGSESAGGAGSTVLPTILERIALAAGDPTGDAGGADGSRQRFLRALAASHCVSADGAHATHPNYPERHEPDHRIAIDGGPVIKVNANVRYATDAATSAWFKLACERAGVPFQEFVVRTDLPCGSTIGPITAARLGVGTVDVGVAQLAMHSARELCGSADPLRLVAALREALR